LSKIFNMKNALLLALLFGSGLVFSCNNATDSATNAISGGDTIINQNPTIVEKDSAVLKDDSATVQTAVGVKDEEKNAISQEAKEAQKLKADEGKLKEKQ